MGEFGKWLLHDDRKELFDYLFAVTLNAVFLVLVVLTLWPAGRGATALALFKGYWGFWTALIIASSLLLLCQRLLRLDLYTRPDAYVISGLVVGGVAQAGWSAFAALAVRDAAAGAGVRAAIALYLVGLLSCWVAFNIVSAFFTGSIYRTVNLYLAAGGFALFSLWPASARALFGWFFDFYGRLLDPYGWFAGL